jgi:plasmid stability protein
MPLLQVRDCPSDVYGELRAVAQREHRSIAQQTVAILSEHLLSAGGRQERNARLERVFAESREFGLRNAKIKEQGFDPVALLREDRDSR